MNNLTVQKQKLNNIELRLNESIRKGKFHLMPKFYKFRALDMFNDLINVCNGGTRNIRVIRKRAIEAFLNAHPDYDLALFCYFQERFPHWEEAKLFSPENLKEMILKFSTSRFHFSVERGLSITAPKFRAIQIKVNPEKTARVIICRGKCKIHSNRDATSSLSTRKILLCNGCKISLNAAIRKKLITEASTPSEIIEYLEKRKKKSVFGKCDVHNNRDAISKGYFVRGLLLCEQCKKKLKVLLRSGAVSMNSYISKKEAISLLKIK